jgi:hypothetical protein
MYKLCYQKTPRSTLHCIALHCIALLALLFRPASMAFKNSYDSLTPSRCLWWIVVLFKFISPLWQRRVSDLLRARSDRESRPERGVECNILFIIEPAEGIKKECSFALEHGRLVFVWIGLFHSLFRCCLTVVKIHVNTNHSWGEIKLVSVQLIWLVTFITRF